MDTTLILDIFTYFAKFPMLEGVQKNFKNSKSLLPGYSDLRLAINNLPNHSLLPDIKEYIFGTNEEELFERIRNMKDMFLFVEYGQINMNVDERTEFTGNRIAIAINVATDFSWTNKDTLEETILMNKTLAVLTNIVKQMQLDDKTNDCPLTRYFNSPTDITPIEPSSFHGKLGWNIMFFKNENLF